LVQTVTGVAAPEGLEEPLITIDYREPTPNEAWSDRVKELYDHGKLIKVIAAELGITRNLASKALDCWYDRQGMARPDGRSRRATLDEPHRVPPLFVQLSEEAMRLYDDGHSLEQIASRLNCSRPTVVKAISHWHRVRELPVPEGRTWRRGSDRSGSRPGGEGGCEREASPPAA
jgi:transposase